MRLTHESVYRDIEAENTFVARDDRKRRVGVVGVSVREMEMLFPERPLQYVIRMDSHESAMAALFGAAVAHIRMVALESDIPSRAYAEINVGDEEALRVLEALGFKNTDGVMRMHRRVTGEENYHLPPKGCTIVRDFLNDPIERRFFLERYNRMYGLENDEKWLEEIVSQPDFARILMVSPDDLCGELLVWTEDGEGVIGMIQTARRWQRKGVAAYLMEDARLYFRSLGIQNSRMDVWMKAPGAMKLARAAGYTDGEPILLYPEMNL